VQSQLAFLQSRVALRGALQAAASYNAAMLVVLFIQRLIATRWARNLTNAVVWDTITFGKYPEYPSF
jgi:dolichyl-phosphate-mannose--protein O-mannosyl transferase